MPISILSLALPVQTAAQVALTWTGSTASSARLPLGRRVFATLLKLFERCAALVVIRARESIEHSGALVHFVNVFKRLAESSERRESKRQEAYLAEATDVYNLEYRMRELDRQNRSKPTWMSGAAE